MNENMPIVGNQTMIHRKRSRLVAGLLIALCTGVMAVAFTLQSCDFGFATSASKPAPQEITGDTVILRTMREDYFIDYHKMFSDAVRKDLEFPEQITLSYTINYLRHELAREKRGEMLMYAIFDKVDNKLIGSTEIRELNDYDPGQVGIWVNENYWGGGRALEALKLITKAYFELHPEHDSYIAHIRLWNKRSYGLFKKAGFQDDGYFYEHGEKTRHILRYTKKK